MKTELLAPAGGEQSARVALLAGADAVYLGLKEFSAREGAENFDESALRRTADFAHLLGAKVYVCLNTLVKDGEMARFFSCARTAWNAGADGILLQDIFLGRALHAAYPEMVLHLSTQAGCCNVYGAELAKEYGFSRVVLARETPLPEIEKIAKIIETEVFVQGALCTCFSGQCYFSSFAGNNSGNRGRCKQPCRKRYRIDRAGFDSYAYALSTSDLCVGERIKELTAAGVASLKIEGRMRREEYVAAAVKYYRALLDGKENGRAFSDLARAYNRGDYTRGLVFGQEGDFLSRSVQGHIGERVGKIELVKGKYFCRSGYAAQKGDGFKILRGGEEAGGAVFSGSGSGGFFLQSSSRLKTGDEVRLTTDSSASARLAAPVRLRRVSIRVRIFADEAPLAEGEGICVAGTSPAQAAQRAPLTEEDILSCFQKTDGAPFSPEITAETADAFLPKSALNALRREFYAALSARLLPPRELLPEREIPQAELMPVAGEKIAFVTDGEGDARADIVVYKPRDYARISLPASGGEKFLWLPPLFTAEDEACVARAIAQFDGIFCEGSYGTLLAKKYGKPLFAGTGFNLTNRYAVAGVRAAGAKYFVLSPELSTKEQDSLSAEGAFSLQAGGIKVMELCYCPFGRSCASCDCRDSYTLTDEAGRKFPLRRYRVAGERCRFEVYNCVPLFSEGGLPSALVDGVTERSALAYYENPAFAPKEITRGHSVRSML